MDRLWVGYWVGGATMAIGVSASYWLTGTGFSILGSIVGWVLFTPLGIMIVNRGTHS